MLGKVLTHFQDWNYQRQVLRQNLESKVLVIICEFGRDAGLEKAWACVAIVRSVNQWSSGTRVSK